MPQKPTYEDLLAENRRLKKEIAQLQEGRDRSTRQRDYIEFFHILLDAIPNPIFYKNAEGKYIGCNLAFEKFIGYKEADLIGKTVFDIAPEEVAQAYYKKDFELIQNPGKQVYEYTVVTAQGDVRSVIFSKAAFFDSNGRTGGIIGVILDITDRKEAEERLRESESRFRQLVEHIDEIFWIQDLYSNQILYISPAFEKIWGISRKTIYENPFAFLDYIHPEEKDRIQKIYQNIHTSCRYDEEFRIVRENGSEKWIRSRIFPIRDEAGDVKRLVGLARDITHEKRNKEQLKAALEASYRQSNEITALLESSRAVLKYDSFKDSARVVFDFCKKLIGATGGYVALLSENKTENEILFLDAGGRPCTVDPELPMPIRGLREQAYLKKTCVYHNDFMKSNWKAFMPEGHVHLENVLFAPLIIQNATVGLIGLANKPGGFTEEDAVISGAFGEIAAIALHNYRSMESRIQAEKNLKRSRDLLEKTLNSINTAIFIIQSDGTVIIECNRSAEKIFGYPKEEMVGRNTAFLHVNDMYLRNFRKIMDHAIHEHGYLDTLEFKMKRKNGEIFATEHNVIALNDEDNNFIGWVSAVRDISDRKILEERLFQSQKMEAIGTLAGGIAHDFNNILFPIMGYTELTMDQLPYDHPLRSNLEEILKAANRAKELVLQILTFSRKTTKELTPTLIQPIVKEALKLLRASLPSTIGIESRIDAHCGHILADSTQIHQVLMNLCSNSYHAMKNKGGKIIVSIAEVELLDDNLDKLSTLEPGLYLKLTVEDTGQGMNPSVCKRVFEPYFTTKQRGDGTGLGLSVVDGIVKEHRGFIRLDSEIDKGTVVDIYFPRISPQQNISIPLRPDETDPQGKERILVVDDEERVVEVIRKMLQKLGYHVTPRYSSTGALEVFCRNPNDFDLVITDMTMPNMTGIDLAHELLRLKPDIPIIICTGHSEMISEEEVQKLGIKELLLKPVQKRQLADIVRKALDKVG